MISKAKIDKLGDKIRLENNSLSEETLNELQAYRTSHSKSLSSVFNSLCESSRLISGDTIVTYRIKRFESIIGKLGRIPEMRFSRMWDIGGCRCIVRTEKEVYRLKSLIESKTTVVKVTDYMKEPKDDGYKSLHLYVSIPDDDKIIEVQLRTTDDHNWATLVEITDLLFDAGLKEYGRNKKLQRFHLLLSKRTNLSFQEKFEVAEIAYNYEYFEKISAVFARNYLQVRRRWMEIENTSNHKFFLIESSKDAPPKIEAYSKFSEAENAYFVNYRSNSNLNIVLTHLPSPSYAKISMAYSNYILTFHSLQDDFFLIMEELILDALKASEFLSFYKHFKNYNKAVLAYISNIVNEIDTILEYINKANKPAKSIKKKKEREWFKDITKRIDKRTANRDRLRKQISTVWPKSNFRKFIFQLIIKFSGWYYNRKLSQILKSRK